MKLKGIDGGPHKRWSMWFNSMIREEPYLGYTRATMAGTTGREAARWSQSLKARPSSDRGLQPDPVKLESLVIAHQPWRGEYVPGPCTHRPSSHGSWGCLKTVTLRGAVQGKTSDWG
jgi:hypothetical protein